MTVVEFRVNQRRRLLTASAAAFVLLLCAVADLVTDADILRGDVRIMLMTLGAGAGPLLLDLAIGKTRLTSTTLTTRSLLGRRSCAWSEIQWIEIHEYHGRGYSAWIYVHIAGGRPIRLRAPFSTSQSKNASLDEAVAVIRRHQAAFGRRSTERR